MWAIYDKLTLKDRSENVHGEGTGSLKYEVTSCWINEFRVFLKK